MDKQTDFVLRTMEERDVRFVRLWFTDVLGSLKSVAISPAEVEGAFAEGVGFDGEEIEEQSAVLRGGERDEVAAAVGIELGVDLLEIGGLAAERRAAIDDLEADGVVVAAMRSPLGCVLSCPSVGPDSWI